MTPATFRTICARCAAPLEYRDPDVALKAHEARCFVVGDYVRWEYNGEWYEGKLLSADGGVASVLVEGPGNAHVSVGAVGHGLSINIRRIPRPEQATLSARLGHLKHGPAGSGLSGPCDDNCRKCAAEAIAHREVKPDNKPCTGTWTQAEPLLYHCSQDDGHSGNCYDYPPSRSEPLYREPTLYDGLTAEQCLARMRARVAAADGLTDLAEIPGWPPGRTVHQELEDGRLAITESQLAAARDLWQSQLRAKVAASKERERLTVMVEQDCEDESWR